MQAATPAIWVLILGTAAVVAAVALLLCLVYALRRHPIVLVALFCAVPLVLLLLGVLIWDTRVEQRNVEVREASHARLAEIGRDLRIAETAIPLPTDDGSVERAPVAEPREEIPDTPKPAWVEQPPQNTADEFYTTVTVGPYVTREEAQRALSVELQQTSGEYIEAIVGQTGAGDVAPLSLAYLQDRVLQEQWIEPYDFNYAPMLRVHALLKYDDEDRQHIRRTFEETLVQKRLVYTGSLAGAVLLVLGTLFGFLQLDTITKGYYSGRLKLAAATVILTVIAAAAMLA